MQLVMHLKKILKFLQMNSCCNPKFLTFIYQLAHSVFQVRLFLLREQEFQEELARQDSAQTEKTISAYESLLMDCKDAIQVCCISVSVGLVFTFCFGAQLVNVKIGLFIIDCLEASHENYSLLFKGKVNFYFDMYGFQTQSRF